MDSLPDEILHHIFSYFTLSEKFKTLEPVCTRWRNATPYNKITDLDLVREFIPSEDRLRRADTFPISSTNLEFLLKRCGPYLERISFGRSNLLIPWTVVGTLGDYCPRLVHLDLSFSTITDQMAVVLLRMADRLRSLDFGNTSFSISRPRDHTDNMRILFSSMVNLESINLRSTSIHNLAAVDDLPDGLRSLNLNACSPLAPETLFKLLMKLYDLEELRLASYSQMNYLIVEAICASSRLRILDISRQTGPVVSRNHDDYEIDWRKLASVTTLEEFHAQYNDLVTDRVLDAISRNCPRLRVLNISYCRLIESFQPWSSRLDNLHSLYVASNESISDYDLKLLIERNGSNLRTIHTPACSRIGGESVRMMTERCPRLVDVNLGQCESGINDEEVELLFRKCPRLENVDLRMSAITDGLFHNLKLFADARRTMRRLQNLDISYCTGITDEGVKSLASFLADGDEKDPMRRRREPITIFVHQTRVNRACAAELACERVKLQF